MEDESIYKLPSLALIKKFMNLDLTCSNCGNIGHLYKICQEPIISYGIICYNKRTNKFLLMQRRHSIAYVDFIRGKYSFKDMNFLFMLLENMSPDEKENLITKKFTDLWNELWINNGIETSYRNNEFKKSKEMFSMLCDGISINNQTYVLNSLIEETKEIKKEIEWGFPKGRRDKNETDLECAIREFREETNMKCNEYYIEPERFIEEFMGSNGISYKYIYFVYFIHSDEQPYIDNDNLDQISEVGDIGWFSLSEATKKITCRRRQGILRKIKIND